MGDLVKDEEQHEQDEQKRVVDDLAEQPNFRVYV